MKQELVKMLVTMLFAVLTPENLKRFVDAGLDAIENAVEGSTNKVDDAIVLPVCKIIRSTFNIPDDDEATDPAEE
jgi:hypothetical protein